MCNIDYRSRIDIFILREEKKEQEEEEEATAKEDDRGATSKNIKILSDTFTYRSLRPTFEEPT